MDKTQNNINSLEEIINKYFHFYVDGEQYEFLDYDENNKPIGLVLDTVVDLREFKKDTKELITTHEQQAYEKAKMELEVEIGLQKFGQLMKEKEAIIQQARRNAVEEFAEWHNDIPDYAIEAVCKVDKEDIEKFLKRKIST